MGGPESGWPNIVFPRCYIYGQYVMTQYLRECFRQTRFIWADKVALVVGFLFSFLLVYLWFLAFLVVGSLGAKHMWENFGILGIELGIVTVASAWFAMRVTDFLSGGSTYRLFDHRPALKDVGS